MKINLIHLSVPNICVKLGTQCKFNRGITVTTVNIKYTANEIRDRVITIQEIVNDGLDYMYKNCSIAHSIKVDNFSTNEINAAKNALTEAGFKVALKKHKDVYYSLTMVV